MTEEETKFREHECKENKIWSSPCTYNRGKTWIIEGEYNFEIKYCPFCGKKLEEEIKQTIVYIKPKKSIWLKASSLWSKLIGKKVWR